jgi:hypothetical protein
VKHSQLIRLYPAHWRERYGAEFSALLEDLPTSPRLVLDVFLSAITARVAQLRRRFLGEALDPGSPSGNAIVAFFLMVPSITLVLAFALKFKVGVAGPFDAISQPSRAIAVLHYFLVFAPWLSLALVSRAMVRPTVRRSGPGLSIQLEGRADPMALAIAFVAVLVLLVLMRYFLFQHSPVWGWSSWSVPWPWFAPPWDRQ